MSNYIIRYAELYKRLGMQFEILNNTIWREYNRMIVPLGFAKQNYSISKEETRFLLSKFKKALLVRYTEGFGKENCMEWYAVICNRFLDLDELSAKNRSEIKRGFRNCNIEKVNANFIAEQGYCVYISAFDRSKGVNKINIITENDFRKRILITKDFDDIVHYWGVFHNGILIAYAINYIYDCIEVNYSSIMLNPDFLKLYPTYALLYTMNKYYLKENSFEYINDGFINILHQTEIQKFLLKKFGFKKAYTKINIVYRPYLHYYLIITFPIRDYLRKINPKLEALYKMEEIRRKETHM